MDILVSPQIERLIRDSLDEDIGAGDLATMATISAESQGTGLFRAKKEGVVAGLVLLERIFYFIDPKVNVRLLTKDGTRVAQGTVVAEAEGPVRALLLAERTALNFLQRLSGTATLTRQYVEAVKAVRRHAPFMAKVEVEAGNLTQVQEAIDAGADVIMLDNMSVAQMAEAVRLVNKRAWVEASGGITLNTIRQIAETGVNFISSGALTHSAPVVDFNMKITMNA